MRLLLITCTAILYAYTATATAEYNASQWRVMATHRHGDIAITCRMVEQPDWSLDQWIAIDLDNDSPAALPVEALRLSLTLTAYDATGREVRHGSLVIEEVAELLGYGQDWMTPAHLAPGKTVIDRQLSAFGLALLGLPEPGSRYRVDADIALHITTDTEAMPEVRWQARPFEFAWHRPTDAALRKAGRRLQELLRHPEDTRHHCHLLQSYLSAAQVSNAVSAEDLLSALDLRLGQADGRRPILKALKERYAQHPAVLAYYRRAIVDSNLYALEDLAHATEIWDVDWVESLLRAFETSPMGVQQRIADILHAHRLDWYTAVRSQRLTMALLSQYKSLVFNLPEQLDIKSKRQWASVIQVLSKVGSPDLIPTLLPFLEDETIVVAPCLANTSQSYRLPRAARLCDYAAEAILRLQGEQLYPYYQARGFEPPYHSSEARTIVLPIRDAIIAELLSTYKR